MFQGPGSGCVLVCLLGRLFANGSGFAVQGFGLLAEFARSVVGLLGCLVGAVC